MDNKDKIVCPQCQAINLVPGSRLVDRCASKSLFGRLADIFEQSGFLMDGKTCPEAEDDHQHVGYGEYDLFFEYT